MQAAADLDQLAAVTAAAGRPTAPPKTWPPNWSLRRRWPTLARGRGRAGPAHQPGEHRGADRAHGQAHPRPTTSWPPSDPTATCRNPVRRRASAGGRARDGFPTLSAASRPSTPPGTPSRPPSRPTRRAPRRPGPHHGDRGGRDRGSPRRSPTSTRPVRRPRRRRARRADRSIEAHDLAVADTRATLADPDLVARRPLAPVSQLEDDAHAAGVTGTSPPRPTPPPEPSSTSSPAAVSRSTNDWSGSTH